MGPNEEPRIGIELKVDKVDEALWDILKMAALRRCAGVEAAYVAVAAARKSWAGSGDCVRLFTAGAPRQPRPDSDLRAQALELLESPARPSAASPQGAPARAGR